MKIRRFQDSPCPDYGVVMLDRSLPSVLRKPDRVICYAPPYKPDQKDIDERNCGVSHQTSL